VEARTGPGAHQAKPAQSKHIGIPCSTFTHTVSSQPAESVGSGHWPGPVIPSLAGLVCDPDVRDPRVSGDRAYVRQPSGAHATLCVVSCAVLGVRRGASWRRQRHPAITRLEATGNGCRDITRLLLEYVRSTAVRVETLTCICVCVSQRDEEVMLPCCLPA
jgi:hypothetical protein